MSNPSQDFISDAEVYLQEKLLAEQAFQGVDVLRAANGDLDAKIEEAIASLGLFIVVKLVGGKCPFVGDAEDWKFVVVVTENALLNRGAAAWNGKTARLLAQKIMQAGQTVAGCSLNTAEEATAEDGFVVWRIEGTIAVALPALET